jgi:hypothetical protein
VEYALLFSLKRPGNFLVSLSLFEPLSYRSQEPGKFPLAACAAAIFSKSWCAFRVRGGIRRPLAHLLSGFTASTPESLLFYGFTIKIQFPARHLFAFRHLGCRSLNTSQNPLQICKEQLIELSGLPG